MNSVMINDDMGVLDEAAKRSMGPRANEDFLIAYLHGLNLDPKSHLAQDIGKRMRYVDYSMRGLMKSLIKITERAIEKAEKREDLRVLARLIREQRHNFKYAERKADKATR